jgi:hypothetical protein
MLLHHQPVCPVAPYGPGLTRIESTCQVAVTVPKNEASAISVPFLDTALAS